MGVVFLGVHRGDAPVAIKVLRRELAHQPGFRERFTREGLAATRVNSPCTAQIIALAADADPPYLVTEFIEGPTLLDAIQTAGPLPSDALVAFAAGVAEAITAMHTAGVTHRDLTPSNVILAEAGPKVIDFGIARADDSSTITRTGAVLGTPAWMAPEQASNDISGPEVDIFAWGSLVAYAATGVAPFGEGKAAALLYRIVHEAPDLTGLKDPLRGLVSQALAKDPTQRPGPDQLLVALIGDQRSDTATSVRDLLATTWTAPVPTVIRQRRHEEGGVSAKPAPRSYLRRDPRRVALFTAALLTLASGAALAATGTLGSSNPHSAKASAPGRTSTTTVTTLAPTTSTTAFPGLPAAPTTGNTTGVTSTVATPPVVAPQLGATSLQLSVNGVNQVCWAMTLVSGANSYEFQYTSSVSGAHSLNYGSSGGCLPPGSSGETVTGQGRARWYANAGPWSNTASTTIP